MVFFGIFVYQTSPFIVIKRKLLLMVKVHSNVLFVNSCWLMRGRVFLNGTHGKTLEESSNA